MQEWYEHANAQGFFKIERTALGAGRDKRWSAVRVVTGDVDETLATGPDAEAALAAVPSDAAQRLRLPGALSGWTWKRGLG